MTQVLEQDRAGVQDILWTVVEPIKNGDDEITTHFTTQVEAQQALVSAWAHSENARYGITINVPNDHYDEFIKWTDEQVYIDHELDEFTADEAREFFVGV